MDVEPEGAEYRAINQHGEVFDVYPEDAEGAEQARQVFRDLPKNCRFRSPLVRGGAALAGAERFDAGEAELLVNNHLPHAIAISARAADDHEQLRAAGLPVEPVVVEAEQTRPMAVALEARAPLAADAAQPLPVRYTIRHAETGELQVALSPTDEVGDEPMLFKPEELPEGVRAASVRTDDGFTAELAIPHDYLDSEQGEPWQSLRLNVMVRDYDEQNLSNPWAHRTEVRWRPTWGSGESYVGSGVLRRASSSER